MLTQHTTTSPRRLKIEGLEARRLLTADLNGDGTVGFTDFLILSAEFGEFVPFSTGADIDGDGQVAMSDFMILADTFGASTVDFQPVFGMSATNSEPVQGSAASISEWSELDGELNPGQPTAEPPVDLSESTLVVVTSGERSLGHFVNIEWVLQDDEEVHVGYRPSVGGPPPPPGTQIPLAAVAIPNTDLPVRFHRLETLFLP